MCPRLARFEDVADMIYRTFQPEVKEVRVEHRIKDNIYEINTLQDSGWITRTATPEELLYSNQDKLREILRIAKEEPTMRKVKTPCPNCGANSWLSGHCEYCGTEVKE